MVLPLEENKYLDGQSYRIGLCNLIAISAISPRWCRPISWRLRTPLVQSSRSVNCWLLPLVRQYDLFSKSTPATAVYRLTKWLEYGISHAAYVLAFMNTL